MWISSRSRRIAIDPRALHGVTINGMPEYGGWGEVSPIDHAFWKADGLASIDGVLYMTVSRHSYRGWASPAGSSTRRRSRGVWVPRTGCGVVQVAVGTIGG